MKKVAKITAFINRTLFIGFLVAAALLLIEKYTALEINNVIVRFLLFYIAVAALPIIAVSFSSFKKTNANFVVLFSALAICALIAFLSWNGVWKTQTIIYRHYENPSLTIEYRMRGDRFSFGYKKQIVKREKVLPFFDLVHKIDTATIDLRQWKRTNEKVNELKIPGEYID